MSRPPCRKGRPSISWPMTKVTICRTSSAALCTTLSPCLGVRGSGPASFSIGDSRRTASAAVSLAVRTTPEADVQIGAIDDWWRHNRNAAPDLFLLEELTASFEVMSAETPPPTPAAIAEQLDRILSSAAFRRAERSSALLRYFVEQVTNKRSEQLKEYTLGTDVLQRGADFDPRTDPIVRAEASRLRTRIEDYYRTEGRSDSVIVTLPKGGYVPQFTRRVSVVLPGGDLLLYTVHAGAGAAADSSAIEVLSMRNERREEIARRHGRPAQLRPGQRRSSRGAAACDAVE